MSRVLLINGSPHGQQGNTCALLQRASTCFAQFQVDVDWLVLREKLEHKLWHAKLSAADMFVFGTGTYWDSWGSPLQDFFERMTETEGTEMWLGKPAGVLVSMHSVGGKAILSRLQGVLSSYGALLPPMSGMVYSALGHAWLMSSEAVGTAVQKDASSIADDIWQLDDIEVIVHNLVTAQRGLRNWRRWPVDAKDYAARWLNS